ALSISSLQQPELWRSVARRITKVEKANWNKHNGQWVTIKGDDKDQRYKVFVDDASHFPLRFVMTKKINTSKRVVEFTQKAQVIRSMDWQVGNSKFIFPLTVEMKGQRSGGEVHEVHSTITSVVKINQPVKTPNIFTIPRSQANVITNHDEKK